MREMKWGTEGERNNAMWAADMQKRLFRDPPASNTALHTLVNTAVLHCTPRYAKHVPAAVCRGMMMPTTRDHRNTHLQKVTPR